VLAVFLLKFLRRKLMKQIRNTFCVAGVSVALFCFCGYAVPLVKYSFDNGEMSPVLSDPLIITTNMIIAGNWAVSSSTETAYIAPDQTGTNIDLNEYLEIPLNKKKHTYDLSRIRFQFGGKNNALTTAYTVHVAVRSSRDNYQQDIVSDSVTIPAQSGDFYYKWVDSDLGGFENLQNIDTNMSLRIYAWDDRNDNPGSKFLTRVDKVEFDGRADAPLLIFMIDKGEGQLIERWGNDPTNLYAQLDNIREGLSDLTGDYRIALTMQGCAYYDVNGYGHSPGSDLDRLHPGLIYYLDYWQQYFAEDRIMVMFDQMGSDVNKILKKVRGTNYVNAPLYIASTNPVSAFSMDIDTLAAVKETYPDIFHGIRLHETIQTMGAWTNTYDTTGSYVDTNAISALIDLCDDYDLYLFWTEACWLMNINTATDMSYVYTNENQARIYWDYFNPVLAKAEDTLGESVGFSIANNDSYPLNMLYYYTQKITSSSLGIKSPLEGWERYDHPFTEFPYKNSAHNDWGYSLQGWMWRSFTKSILNIDFPLAIMQMPDELHGTYILRALNQGADVLQFEPAEVFFNICYPSYPTCPVWEESEDYSVRLGFKRIKKWLLDPGAINNPPPLMSSVFDSDGQALVENDVSDIPKTLNQTTLCVAYTNVATPNTYINFHDSACSSWFHENEDRSPPCVFAGDVMETGSIDVFGDGFDSIFVAKRVANNLINVEFYSRKGYKLKNTETITDYSSTKGSPVAIVAGNFISEVSGRGDPDELLVIRRNASNQLNFLFYKASFAADNIIFEYYQLDNTANDSLISTLLSTASLSGANFLDATGLRASNVIYTNSARMRDYIYFLETSGSNVVVKTKRGGGPRSWILSHGGRHLLAFDYAKTQSDMLGVVSSSGGNCSLKMYAPGVTSLTYTVTASSMNSIPYSNVGKVTAFGGALPYFDSPY
jgi:hypothetical protein